MITKTVNESANRYAWLAGREKNNNQISQWRQVKDAYAYHTRKSICIPYQMHNGAIRCWVMLTDGSRCHLEQSGVNRCTTMATDDDQSIPLTTGGSRWQCKPRYKGASSSIRYTAHGIECHRSVGLRISRTIPIDNNNRHASAVGKTVFDNYKNN